MCRWDEMPTLSIIGDLKNKTLEELDILRGQEQAKMEMFLDGKVTTSTQWWQNRIRKKLGVEVSLEVLEDLKKDAGGFATKTTGYLVDYAHIAIGFSAGMYKNALKKYDDFAGIQAQTFTSSARHTYASDTGSVEFYSKYVDTDDVIKFSDLLGQKIFAANRKTTPTAIRFKCYGIKKLLPYNGFYPVTRSPLNFS